MSSEPLEIRIFEDGRFSISFPFERAIEVGRRDVTEVAPYALVSVDRGLDRLIIADLTETSISRRQLRIEASGAAGVTIENLSDKNTVPVVDQPRLDSRERRLFRVPVTCELGRRVVRIESARGADSPRAESIPLESSVQSLARPPVAPGLSSVIPAGRLLSALADSSTDAGARDKLLGILRELQGALDSMHNATSDDFLRKAAQTAADVVALDAAVVLQRRGEGWETRASHSRVGQPLAADWLPSRSMLQRLLDERRTFFHVPDQGGSTAQSLVRVQSLVAAPILDRQGEVVGALYGERLLGISQLNATPISEVEANLFEMLACGIAAGLARVQQEQQLVAERVRFEQFFSPELARVLAARGEEILAPRDAEITVLFCDIREFSRITASHGAELAIEWVRDVLSELSDCVAEQSGVVVDYGGDSLEAMWGAPLAAPAHARLACRAAIAMWRRLATLDQRWLDRLGEPTAIGIGIHTGTAKVGNVGSRRKLKYGAFGTIVNVASRVQGATRQVGVPILATSATIEQLDAEFPTRRLCTIRAVNIPDPLEVHELATSCEPKWLTLKSGYENALDQFESARLAETIQSLGRLLAEHPRDEPTHRLLQRTAAQLGQPQRDFTRVWTLPTK